jgi:hypothetical protein
MTQPDFLAMLETDLALRGVAWARAELIAYVASMWPWMDDDPDVARWAEEFVAAQAPPRRPPRLHRGSGGFF